MMDRKIEHQNSFKTTKCNQTVKQWSSDVDPFQYHAIPLKIKSVSWFYIL